MATPSVSAPARASRGQGVDLSYRFAVAADAPRFEEDYTVFVHAYDAQGNRIWTDDHQPPLPTRQWKPGQVIEYSRSMAVPNNASAGSVTLEVGLYSRQSRDRLPLAGSSGSSRRSYGVASFDVLPESGPPLYFLDGWHGHEVLDHLEWRWSTRSATISARNPRRDSTLVLHLDQPVNTGEPPRVEVLTGSTALDTFVVPIGQPITRRIRVSAEQIGQDQVARFTIRVSRSFVPATIEALGSSDRRELGVRVFSAHLETTGMNTGD